MRVSVKVYLLIADGFKGEQIGRKVGKLRRLKTTKTKNMENIFQVKIVNMILSAVTTFYILIGLLS